MLRGSPLTPRSQVCSRCPVSVFTAGLSDCGEPWVTCEKSVTRESRDQLRQSFMSWVFRALVS